MLVGRSRFRPFPVAEVFDALKVEYDVPRVLLNQVREKFFLVCGLGEKSTPGRFVWLVPVGVGVVIFFGDVVPEANEIRFGFTDGGDVWVKVGDVERSGVADGDFVGELDESVDVVFSIFVLFSGDMVSVDGVLAIEVSVDGLTFEGTLSVGEEDPFALEAEGHCVDSSFTSLML